MMGIYIKLSNHNHQITFICFSS